MMHARKKIFPLLFIPSTPPPFDGFVEPPCPPPHRPSLRASTTARTPGNIATGSWPSMRRWPVCRWPSPRMAAYARDTSSSSTATTWAWTSNCMTRSTASASSTPTLRPPAGALGHHHQRQGAHLLLGREHLHAGPLQPRLEGQFLQVHERNAQRHGGLVPVLRHQIRGRREWHLRRRGL